MEAPAFGSRPDAAPWISVPQIGKVAEAPNLAALKTEIERRWRIYSRPTRKDAERSLELLDVDS